ncbi:ribonuclease H-like domain-containing protein, partial [Tanacetum coccineum]
AFFQRWWRDQSEATQTTVKGLVSSDHLESIDHIPQMIDSSSRMFQKNQSVKDCVALSILLQPLTSRKISIQRDLHVVSERVEKLLSRRQKPAINLIIIKLLKAGSEMVVMISMKMKKFYKKTVERKLNLMPMNQLVLTTKTKVECYSCPRQGILRESADPRGIQDSWRGDAWKHWSLEGDQRTMALMDCSSTCSERRGNNFGDASIEIQAYTQALKKVEAQLVAHQQSQLWYKEKISQMSARDKVEWLVLLGKKGKLLLSPQQVIIGDTKDITGIKSPNTMVDQVLEIDYPQRALQNKGIVDSGCSRHMTRNKAYLAEYQDFNCGLVAFEGSKGYITGKGKIKIGKLDFEYVCFVKELQNFNLFFVSHMCDKKNKVLFTNTECLVLSPEFKLPDENQVLLRIPRQNNMYSFNLENIVPSGGLAYLIVKAIIDESNKWHRRLGHVNFKNSNKLVEGNLVRGLPSKIFQNDHTCVACQNREELHKGLLVRPKSNLRTGILLNYVGQKGSRGNTVMPELHNKMELLKERTGPLFEAARTLLADSFLPNTFWDEAVSTACYVLNRLYIRPFGCHVTILNTIDHLGKFDGKSDEGFLVGYSLQSKAFRVYNLETKRVEENLHITFLENKPNVAGKGPTWLFDLDYLTDSMNYQPVRSENQANKHAGPQEANQNAGTEENIDAGDSPIEAESAQDYFVLPIWSSYTSTVKSSKANNAGEEPTKHPDLKPVDKEDQVFLDELERLKRQEQDANDAAEALRKDTASPYGGLSFTDLTNTDQDDSEIPALEEIYDNPTDGIFTNSSYDDEGAVADFTNLEPVVNVSPIPTSRINSIHPSTLILGDPQSYHCESQTEQIFAAC